MRPAHETPPSPAPSPGRPEPRQAARQPLRPTARPTVSGSRPQADDVVADAPAAYRRGHPDHRRAQDPADRRHARHANHPQHPAHDDAPAAHRHGLDPAHHQAARPDPEHRPSARRDLAHHQMARRDLARPGPPRHDASGRGQPPGRRRGRRPGHPPHGMATDVVLARACGGYRARPPTRPPAQACRDEPAPRPGPCSAFPADHAHRCPVQARRPAHRHHHARQVA